MSGGHGEKLTRKREQALAALLTQPTLSAAAEQVGVNERTLRCWLAEPSFSAAYRAARRQVVEGTVLQLQQAAGEAVAALRRNLACGQHGVDVRAAVAVLELVLRSGDLDRLEHELAELREAVARAHSAGHAARGPTPARARGLHALGEPAA